jgi:hypothetical protein
MHEHTGNPLGVTIKVLSLNVKLYITINLNMKIKIKTQFESNFDLFFEYFFISISLTTAYISINLPLSRIATVLYELTNTIIMYFRFQSARSAKRQRASTSSITPATSPKSPPKKVTHRYNNPDTSGSEYDENFPVSGTGAGKGPAVPIGPINDDDRNEAIGALRNRVEWLEAREAHFIDKIADLKQEIGKMQLEAIDRQRSLHVDAIRATLKTIQGISTNTKRLQTSPHDMDACHIRIKKYKLPWTKITVPPRDINPHPVDIKLIDWDTIEAKRVESFPEDKPNIPIGWYIKSFELKAGSARAAQANVEEFTHRDDNRRGGRGDHAQRYRGYRNNRGRGYRGN